MPGGLDHEGALVEAALSGQQEAYRELFSRYYARIMRTCAATLRDQDEAADAAQETFIRAFRSLRTLEEPDRFGPWLYAIADNVCRTRWRQAATRDSRVKELSLARVEGPEDEHPALREEKIRLVQDEIAALPDGRARELLELYYVDGTLTTREIAARTGMPHGTVCVTLMRLRARIQKRLAAALLRLEEASHAL